MFSIHCTIYLLRTLLYIFSCTAEVDVEAQDDGIVGKILLDEKESSIQVGAVIAMLAEEGDDISNIQAPQSSEASSSSSSSASSTSASTSEESTSSSKQDSDKTDTQAFEENKASTHVSSSPQTPSNTSSSSTSASSHSSSDKHATHSMPLMPSVMRLLAEHGITDTSKIKATGYRGRLSKGDILVHLGKVDNPLASAIKLEELKKKEQDKPKDENKPGKKHDPEPMSGPEFRRWIASGLSKVQQQQQSTAASIVQTPVPVITFDDILEGYVRKNPLVSDVIPASALAPTQKAKSGWDEVLGF